jgi:hypothetical protein
MTTETTLDLTADVIDVRDIIARYEELESESVIFLDESDDDARTAAWRAANPDAAAELAALRDILDELKGYGGDEQWRGDWYPVTLVSDKYFEDHARELLDDCGVIPKDLPHYVAIDWETTAQNIQVDYTPVEIDGLTYWYR